MHLCYNTGHEFIIYRYRYSVTQQPFELKLTMPPTDRGGRGYSDEYVAIVTKELQITADGSGVKPSNADYQTL